MFLIVVKAIMYPCKNYYRLKDFHNFIKIFTSLAMMMKQYMQHWAYSGAMEGDILSALLY